MTSARRPADGTGGIGLLGTVGIVRRSFVPAVKDTPGARLVAVLTRRPLAGADLHPKNPRSSAYVSSGACSAG